MTNEVLENIKKRRSVRAFKTEAVPRELLDARRELMPRREKGGNLPRL